MNTPARQTRKSAPGDAARLYDVWFTAVSATHDFVTPADMTRIARMVRDQYLPDTELDVVVDEDDRPLAFMGMSGAEIDSLFVHADWRGKGLGRLLVDLACRRAEVLRVEVNEQNRQGVGFWKAMGFREVGRSETDGQGMPYPLLIMERSADREAS
ncbi:MAG: acetyltransferase [Woeseiaceae bacterium]|nr:acetyltransferase [Woeseiaceae bacterium]